MAKALQKIRLHAHAPMLPRRRDRRTPQACWTKTRQRETARDNVDGWRTRYLKATFVIPSEGIPSRVDLCLATPSRRPSHTQQLKYPTTSNIDALYR